MKLCILFLKYIFIDSVYTFWEQPVYCVFELRGNTPKEAEQVFFLLHILSRVQCGA